MNWDQVKRNWASVSGDVKLKWGKFTSVALYGLEQKEDTRRYLFAGAISFTEFDELLHHVV